MQSTWSLQNWHNWQPRAKFLWSGPCLSAFIRTLLLCPIPWLFGSGTGKLEEGNSIPQWRSWFLVPGAT